MNDASAGGCFEGERAAFLNFCRVEKGLAANSLEAYEADLLKFAQFCAGEPESGLPNVEAAGRYVDSLFQSGLGSRSVARHLSTLRSFYSFLLREGTIHADPTEHLGAPKQWQTIPKFLNLEDIDKIIQTTDITRPNGLRARAMLELLYATGLRVSELCRLGLGDCNLDLGVVRTTGKGNKQRLVPAGKEA